MTLVEHSPERRSPFGTFVLLLVVTGAVVLQQWASRPVAREETDSHARTDTAGEVEKGVNNTVAAH